MQREPKASATYAYLDSVYGIFLITLDHTNRV